MPSFIFDDIVTDSRKITQGSLFIALKGENFNGEDFAIEAIDKGAAGVVVSDNCSEDKLPKSGLVLKVKDTLAAYQAFAQAWRDKFKLPLVAVTGSNGKTTTKDLTAAALSALGSIQKTSGNFNNEIGVPLTLLGLNSNHRAAVVEIGMRGLGQIEALSKIVKPTIAIVTNVTETHIELLGSMENIAKAKSELVEAINSGGTVILNADDENVYNMKSKAKEGVKVLTFGLSDKADIQAFNINSDNGSTFFNVKYAGQTYNFEIPMLGRHNVLNSLAAIGAAISVGLNCEEINNGFATLATTKMRFEIIERDGLHIINDAYNASPASMRVSLQTAAEIAPSRKIAVLGDMLELGDSSKQLHIKVGHEVVNNGFDALIVLGPLAKYIAQGAREMGLDEDKIFCTDSHESAAKLLNGLIIEGDTVLFKGSRGMKMEKIIELI